MKIDKINEYTFQFYYEFSTGLTENIGKCCVRVMNKNDCPIVIELGQCINNSVPSIINYIDLINVPILKQIKEIINVTKYDNIKLDFKNVAVALLNFIQPTMSDDTVGFLVALLQCIIPLVNLNKKSINLNKAIWVLYYPSEIINDGFERFFFAKITDEKKLDKLEPFSISNLVELSGLDENDLLISKDYLR